QSSTSFSPSGRERGSAEGEELWSEAEGTAPIGSTAQATSTEERPRQASSTRPSTRRDIVQRTDEGAITSARLVPVARADVHAPGGVGGKVAAQRKERRDPLVREAIEGEAPALLPLDQAAVQQARQVVGGVGLRQPRDLHDLGDAPLSAPQRLDDG